MYVFAFCFVVLWLALVFWTYKDARKRIDDPIIVGVAVLTSLILPYMGTVVYAILRPAEYLAERQERELEMRAMEQELHGPAGVPYLWGADPPGLRRLPELSPAVACARVPVATECWSRAGSSVPIAGRTSRPRGCLRRWDPTHEAEDACVSGDHVRFQA